MDNFFLQKFSELVEPYKIFYIFSFSENFNQPNNTIIQPYARVSDVCPLWKVIIFELFFESKYPNIPPENPTFGTISSSFNK